MHMSDALISPAVAATAGAVSLILLGTAIRKVGRESRDDTASLPRMGVMGAFVFAAQLINFAIPGTGSSGHLVGGILLATLLGPWAGLLTLASVLFLQCLLFADGGFLALGCNLFNMAVLSCLVAWPTVYRPIAGSGGSPRRVFAAALLAGIAAAVLGALAVTAETELSGITALPWGRFLLFMLPIHLLIGIGEGLATAAVLAAVRRYRPELLNGPQHTGPSRRGVRLLLPIIVATLLVAGTFSWIASSDPDGLEWSIEQVAGTSELPAGSDAPHRTAAVIQERTALLPDYGTSFAGIVGSGLLLAVAFGASLFIRVGRRQS